MFRTYGAYPVPECPIAPARKHPALRKNGASITASNPKHLAIHRLARTPPAASITRKNTPKPHRKQSKAPRNPPPRRKPAKAPAPHRRPKHPKANFTQNLNIRPKSQAPQAFSGRNTGKCIQKTGFRLYNSRGQAREQAHKAGGKNDNNRKVTKSSK